MMGLTPVTSWCSPAAAAAVSVDEAGGRVRWRCWEPASRATACRTPDPAEVRREIAIQRGQAMRGLGVTIYFDRGRRHDESDDEADGDRCFGLGIRRNVDFAAQTPRGRGRRVAAGAATLPRRWPRTGRSHERGRRDPAAGRSGGQRPRAGPDADHTGAGRGDGGSLQVPRPTGTDPASLSPAAYNLLVRATTAGRRSADWCSATTCRGWGPSTSATASPPRCCRRCRPVPTWRWVTTTRRPWCWTDWRRCCRRRTVAGRVDQLVLKVAGQKGPNPKC